VDAFYFAVATLTASSIQDPDLVLDDRWLKLFAVFYLPVGIGILVEIARGLGSRSWRPAGRTGRRRPATPTRRPSSSAPLSIRIEWEHVFVSTQATILHADLDSFFASVEQRDDARLRARPVIVGAGVVLAASYEAKACGVRTAMGGARARRLCPQAVVVPPRFSAYTEASKAVFAVFRETSPLVEGLSIDEAFLDVRGMERIAGTPVEIAARLRREVREQVGLPITVGIARTKFLAKVASAVAKPDGLLVVPPDGELAFLHPLPVERLWGVGPATARKLHALGLITVGQVAQLAEPALVEIVGRAAGRHLHALAHNRDPRPVQVGRRRRSIGSQRALGRRRRSPAELDASVVAIADRLGRRLRAARRVCRTVVLRLRFDDFSRATRSHTLPEATARTGTILATARELLAAAMPAIERQGLTLVGLSLANLEDDGAVQLALPLDRRAPPEALDATLDDVRDRFGSAAITRAVLLDRDQGISMPLLPD
jgi:DNA polymerase-4